MMNQIAVAFMQPKTLLRLAYLIVALALLMWVGIGGAIWSAWRGHQEALAANGPAGASLTPSTGDLLAEEPFNRSKSTVQYEQLAADADPSQVPDWLNRQIGPLPPISQPMVGWAVSLSKQGVQVCCWERPITTAVREPGFALPIDRGTVRELLDELCRCDPRYRWEWMTGSEIVNIVPVASALPVAPGLPIGNGEAPIGDVSFRPKRLYFCLADVSGHVYMAPYGARQEPYGYGDILYWPFSVKAKQITVRDYLNLLAAQYDGMTWCVNDRNIVEFDAPEATRQEVIEKYRDEPRQ
jgi:hypothetical protein